MARIWFQKHTVAGRLPGLDEMYHQHFDAVRSAGTEVVVHTLPEATYPDRIPAGMVRYGAVEALFAPYFAATARRAEKEGYDAYVIGTSQDPGLWEARALASIPVLAYGETAFHFAAMTGRRFAVVGFIPELREPIEENIRRYGLTDKLVGFEYSPELGPEAVVDALNGDPKAFLAAFIETATRAARRGAELIVPGEGLPNEILVHADVRQIAGAAVLDVDGLLVRMAELLAGLRSSGIAPDAETGYRSRRPDEAVLDHMFDLFAPKVLK
ncbi:aspartate/glutamate racemase family protein [Micromonospora sp. NPDC005299]|uniref:aspartate/glutamate racemase family protein n=1 Tax=Micromonospora sp. NPDC005299 TaxID=3364231 RepID=UPI003673D466